MLDCATSITQRGKIEYYARIGQGHACRHGNRRDGSAMTDSVQILRTHGDAARPLAGSGELAGQGYGMTVVEVLSSALQAGFLALNGLDAQGKTALPPTLLPCDRPEAFLGLDSFKKTCGDILRGLRVRKAPVGDRIYTAGENTGWLERKDSASLSENPFRKNCLPCATRCLPYRFRLRNDPPFDICTAHDSSNADRASNRAVIIPCMYSV